MVDWDALVLGPCLAVFGDPVTFVPVIGSPIAISGVFDEAYGEVVLDGEVPITSESPVLGVRLSAFVAPPQQGDALVVRNSRYVVREVRPDGHGGAKLMLNYAGEQAG